MRKIPTTMATQHPDNATKPYWHHEKFIATNYEPHECFLMYKDLGIHEYNWDWEGKYVDEALFEKLVGENFDFFQKKQIGKDLFLTIRLPNPETTTEFRLGRAMMSIIGASGLAHKIGVHSPPLFEVILPMIENSKQMLDIQEAFEEIAGLKHWLFDIDSHSIDHISIIPLFEQVDVIMDSDKVLERYLAQHEKKFKMTPEYLRPYIARSDPALNAGFVPTILSIKYALSRYLSFEKKYEILLFPMLGCASLPFRGGLTPRTYEDFMDVYAGLRTVVIQSAFRYDYPKEEVIKAIESIHERLPKTQARLFTQEEEKIIRQIVKIFSRYYRETIEEIAWAVNAVAEHVPKRRERVQHIGLFGYSRGIGNVKLPRAIKFTASLYSLGIPPEIIGTGRGLRAIKKEGLLKDLLNIYPQLSQDMERVLPYYNESNIKSLSKKNSAFEDIIEDRKAIEEILGVSPTLNPEHKEHEIITGKIFSAWQNHELQEKLIEEAAICRRSMG